jgi:hypothetical protein
MQRTALNVRKEEHAKQNLKETDWAPIQCGSIRQNVHYDATKPKTKHNNG